MIKSIRLKNIRNFNDSTFDFRPGINLIVGRNGSGKTTILESIGLLAFGKYLSIIQDVYAIRKGEQVGRIEAVLEGKYQKAEIGLSRTEKVIKLHETKAPVSELVGLLPQIFFNPETVELVFDSPALRRRELDMVLTQADHHFVVDILSFKKILKERNALLRSVAARRASAEELEFWNERFVDYSQKIFSARNDLIKYYNRKITPIFQEISQKNVVLSLKYLPSGDYERFSETLAAHQEMDIENGLTSVGPHRDDFVFLLDGHSMREGASRGEQRLAAVAFKAVASNFLIDQGRQPIIILDDVFSELDQIRREAIANSLQLFEVKQVFISATDKVAVPKNLLKKLHLIKL